MSSRPKRPRLPARVASSLSLRSRASASAGSLMIPALKPSLSSVSINAKSDLNSDPEGSDGEYVNPLHSTPRWLLTTRAVALRTAATLGASVFGWFYGPQRTIYLDTPVFLRRQGSEPTKGKIEVCIWEPSKRNNAAFPRSNASGSVNGGGSGSSSHNSNSNSNSSNNSSNHSLQFGRDAAGSNVSVGSNTSNASDGSTSTSPPTPPERGRPAIINFHGGGFFLGLATDDAWWAAAAAKGLDATVFSIGYRLAPGHPFPTPVEDCADAILQIAARADEFGIDPSRISLSGFSAGGNLCLSSWAILTTPERWGYEIKTAVPALASMAIFYPALDYTVDRCKKRLTCCRPDQTLSPFLTDVIDASYIYPHLSRAERADIRLSPALMDYDMLSKLPPVHLCLCEYDMLLSEGQIFADRLRKVERLSELRLVPKERHAWDKPPPLGIKQSAVEEYERAISSIRTAMGIYSPTLGSDTEQT